MGRMKIEKKVILNMQKNIKIQGGYTLKLLDGFSV